MANSAPTNFIIGFVSIVLGAAAAGVTLVGLVNSNVNTPPENSADVSQPVIDYGTRN